VPLRRSDDALDARLGIESDESDRTRALPEETDDIFEIISSVCVCFLLNFIVWVL